MVNFQTLCILALAFISSGNVAANRNCGGRLFVDEAVVIDLPTQDDCSWVFQTKGDRILVFTVIGGNLDEAQEFITIHDGVGIDSPIILAENHQVQEDSVRALYTKQSIASVHLKQAPMSNLQLKIQKAVDCPSNIGLNTECARPVDEISCYCVDNNLRSHSDHTTACLNSGFRLLALESRTEENVLLSTWNTNAPYWTSLTDNLNEGYWIWGSTGSGIVGGYFNWAISQPDGSGNCVHLNDASLQGGWNDDNCFNLHEAICESQA